MTNLLRAALQPRIVRPILLAIAGATLLCGALVLGMSLARAEITVAPPVVFVPQPNVTVSPAPVVMPPTPVVVQAPPAPEPPSPPPPPPQPRALAPTLDPACVVRPENNPTCAWDEGFPAISADGTLIATKYVPPSGQADFFGLSIHFIDARTSRLVRDSVILTRDEAAAYKYAKVDAAGKEASSEEHLKEQQRLLTAIYRRVARVQGTLDTGRFRTMLALGSLRGTQGEPEPSVRGPHPVYAEIFYTSVRIIDSVASQVLWRGEFAAYGPKRPEDDTSDCGGWGLWSSELWWDPKTRYVLAAQEYRTGGCMCPDVPVEIVQRMR